MQYRKMTKKNRDRIVYTDVNGRKIEIKEGDYSPTDGRRITREDIANYYHLDDLEVINNNRNSCVPFTEAEKKMNKEWEAAHPGEEVPKKWHASLDALYETGEDGEDRSPVAMQVYNRMESINNEVERFYEVLESLPKEISYCLLRVKIEGYSEMEVARELGVDVSTVSRRIHKAIRHIKENFYNY